MRVWLGILVLGVLVTGGLSVYLVENPPARAEPAAPAPAAPDDASGGPLGSLPRDATSATTPLSPPSGLEEGIVADPDAPPLVPPPDGPLGPPDAEAPANAAPAGDDAAPGAGPGGGPDALPTEDDTDDAPPTGGGGSGSGDDETPDEPPAPPPPLAPRSWTWTHDYRTEGPAPDAFDVPSGGRSHLEFRVVFSAPPAAVPALDAVSATLVGPDSVAKVPCASSGLLVGQVACGPFRTEALPGRWEVQYAGSGGVTATLTLTEVP